MKDIQQAVAAYLAAETGVRTVCDRSRLAEYPLLAVSVEEKNAVLVDGGRQAETTFAVTITAKADRTGEGNGALLSSAAQALLGGVPMMTRGGEKRVLHPSDCETTGETLTFNVTVCMPIPDRRRPQSAGIMQELHVTL